MAADRLACDPDLPDEFDAEFYRTRHPDLVHMNESQLFEHFEVFGRKEGRTASRVAHRLEFVKLVISAASILEIGPFCNPVMRGDNVRYFDVLDSAGLRIRAKSIGYPIKSVPRIDYIDPTGDLSVIDRRFAAVFSAHCIEHQPDLIRHLRQVEQILGEGGRYFLIIPDKRYCFDHFIAETTIAEVLGSHLAGQRIHRVESVIEHRALITHNDPARHWRGDHAEPAYLEDVPARVRTALEEYRNAAGRYIDVHAWQFTPGSFRRICEQLFALGYTRLRPTRVYDTPFDSNEFTAVLERHA